MGDSSHTNEILARTTGTRCEEATNSLVCITLHYVLWL